MAGGSGWGKLKPSKRVKNIKQLKTGRVILTHSLQFHADNVVRITRQDETGLNRPLVYGVFVSPRNTEKLRMESDREFVIWDFNLNSNEYLEVAA